MPDIVERAVMVLVPMILSLSVHEYAHARSAYALGDRTALRAGRMTLNPVSHIDPFGTLVLPLISIVSGSHFFFGWARPVPIDPSNLDRRFRMKTGVLLTAASGPASNILFALAIGLLIKVLTVAGVVSVPVWAMLPGAAETWQQVSGTPVPPVLRLLGMTLLINVILAIFNFIPIPPLDGSRVLAGLLPDRLGRTWDALERNPVFIILALTVLIVTAGRFLRLPVTWMIQGILWATGNG